MEESFVEDCFVYVLGCASGRRYLTYVGWTLDLDRRLAQHNAGTGARSTRGRSWVLIHSERFTTRQQAMSREWHLKRDRTLRKRLAAQAKGNIQKPQSGVELTASVTPR
ncbi:MULTISPECIES: GIY-YIG nuclease family protein [Rhodopseudomonas]|uniref:Excinuclease ABC subunit C n=1 Tax=Rhodopseudomonas palustris TaxID=1076 RepID=A0A0D7E8K1_RHOPL|nr:MULTISPECIES: GIY-YIG nuclease family protein [Rhodopseudomonas]KIZ37103.1 excinuclease ABC subunit C [Rhodopseudomonas palustris]MDF3810136.1 GIY-YIG nuclease family protein [Rhodopseudomonas sp. BAL398]WOK18241.1 GIY-YIG nuclease family protein [Rhodopseudomonas sp. BAL398]